MLRTIFALWISCVAGAALLAEGSSAEGQDKTELLRSLHFQKGSVTIGESLASIALTDKFVFLDSEEAKTFLTKVWENPPAVASRTVIASSSVFEALRDEAKAHYLALAVLIATLFTVSTLSPHELEC